MSIQIDLPVFSAETTGRTTQLKSFDPEFRQFSVVDVNTGIVSNRARPLDAQRLYLNTSNGRTPHLGDSRAITYLLDLGVSNLINIPDRVYPRYRSIRELIDRLDQLPHTNTHVTYEASYDRYIIHDDDLSNLCSLIISPKGKPLRHIVAILANHGYHVRKLEAKLGWLYAVIHTPNGSVIFG
ncbi:hypothetical protein D3C73_1219120 [compost metagenome]